MNDNTLEIEDNLGLIKNNIDESSEYGSLSLYNILYINGSEIKLLYLGTPNIYWATNKNSA